MSKDLRYEIKFILDSHNISIVENWIKYAAGCKKKYPNRWVNSIYFEDPMDTSIIDNISGNNNRIKVRLRWYGNVELKEVLSPKLEYKIKNGRLSKKITLAVPKLRDKTLNSNQSIIRKIIVQRCKKNSLNHYFLKNHFFSKLMTTYNRKYFENSKGLRVTIDSKIDFRRLLLNKSINDSKKLTYSKKIVELKFNPSKKDYVSKLLKELSLTPKKHSKYLIGMAKFNELVYI
jgi:hypothetical protein|tara:strand:+ start:928 stop:1623 length:696 start_codon:yes stop_codon:yes gene_type:complete